MDTMDDMSDLEVTGLRTIRVRSLSSMISGDADGAIRVVFSSSSPEVVRPLLINLVLSSSAAIFCFLVFEYF